MRSAKTGEPSVEPPVEPSGRGLAGAALGRAAVVLAIAALAAMLAWNRLAWLEWMEFDREQVDTLVLARRSLEEGGAERGLRLSKGIDMPALFIDLVGLPLRLGLGPVGVAAFVALLNLAGIAAFLALSRRIFPARSALVATLLYASMPWSVLLSRKIWAQDLVAPFAIAAGWLLASAWAGARAAGLRAALALVAFSLACQLYPSPWFLIPAIAPVVSLLPPPIGRRGALLACAAAALPWLAWLRQQLAEGFDGFVYAWNGGVDFPRSALEIARSVWAHAGASVAVASGSSLSWLFGPDELQRLASGPAAEPAWLVVRAADLLYAAALVHGAVWAALRLRERARGVVLAAPARALVLFGLLPPTLVAGYALAGVPPLAHYHAVLLPFQPLLLVAAARSLLSRLPRLALALPGSLAVANAVLVLAILAHVRARAQDLGHRYHPYAPSRELWERELAGALEEARGREERLARERARARARFDASRTVLFRVAGGADAAQLVPWRGAKLEAQAASLLVRGGSPRSVVALPGIDAPRGSSVILRLDLESPRDGGLQVFYRDRATPEYLPSVFVHEPIVRGRTELYLELPADEVAGRPLLRLPVASYRLHAAEARAVAP